VFEAQRTITYIESLARNIRRSIPVRAVANRIRRGTTLSRHLLAELDRLGLPRLRTVLSEAVAYGEIGFSGALPKEGAAAGELVALMAELREQGWLPKLHDKPESRIYGIK